MLKNCETQPVTGIARLYEFLAHVKTFPAPLRVAAVVSGIGDQDVKRILDHSPLFTVLADGKIDRGDTYEADKGDEIMRDLTTGFIETPGGVGRYVGFNPTSGKVTVEMDCQYLVDYDGGKCYPINHMKEGV